MKAIRDLSSPEAVAEQSSLTLETARSHKMVRDWRLCDDNRCVLLTVHISASGLHETQTILTNVCSVCLSVSLSVSLSVMQVKSVAVHAVYTVCRECRVIQCQITLTTCLLTDCWLFSAETVNSLFI